MAFDGTVVAAVVCELKKKLVGGRVLKISQPEKDELIITVKNYDQYHLFLSADAAMPLIYIAHDRKEAPLSSPAFCMLLRKHLSGARIIDISQPSFERIVNIDLEHLDEMGDLCRKRLIIEIMGKHSNIIFCDDQGTIIDSIKRVPAFVSSVREVLPGREYFITRTVDKAVPLTISEEEFVRRLRAFSGPVVNAISASFTGISPLTAAEIVFRSGIGPEPVTDTIGIVELRALWLEFSGLMTKLSAGEFFPNIVMKGSEVSEFAPIRLTFMDGAPGMTVKEYPDICSLLETFYAARNLQMKIRQRSSDLRRIVTTLIERESRKYDLQINQLKDTEKRDKYKLYGELLSAFGYSLEPGIRSAVLNNYYTGEDITVPLDPDYSAIENAKRYYDRYSKLKRTYEALTELVVSTKESLDHLQSIRMSLDIAAQPDDLNAIRDELTEFGYIKKHSAGGRQSKNQGKSSPRRNISRPFHFVTEDGFDIYVGRNNMQNDELTFKLASGDDWWFHAKGMPGSHVVLKKAGREIPDRVFELAAGAAAYFSDGRTSDKTEVDYLEKRNVKKPAGSRPGFVVYYTNYSLMAVPGIGELRPAD